MNPTNGNDGNKILTLDDFGFYFPPSLVAQNPLAERDASRLLFWNSHEISHYLVKNLDSIVPQDSLFIVNNSRVIASRIHGRLNTGAHIEVLLLEPTTSHESLQENWLCLGKPMRKLRTGAEITFAAGLQGEVIEMGAESDVGPQPFKMRFNLRANHLLEWLDQFGEMPLPPYISRKQPESDQQIKDRQSYQTVYAQGAGSVAAPTAGLHFNEILISKLRGKNCDFANVTLHIGAGTFLPVKTHDPSKHSMHSERFIVPKSTFQAIRNAQDAKRPIIIVGTTALRTLEGLADLSRQQNVSMDSLVDKWLRTDIFIRPKTREDRYKPWAGDYLMTNFHQPQSTLFMLVCALIGFDQTHKIYAQAVSAQYRLFSYGDSSLLSLK